MIKKYVIFSTILGLSMLSPVFAADNNVTLKSVEVSAQAEDYYTQLYETELYNYKIVRDLPMLYEEDLYDDYISMGNSLPKYDLNNLSDSQKNTLEKMLALQENLVQIKPAEDVVWKIWGDTMPSCEDVSGLIFTSESYDNSDFQPFLTPYILEDQSNIKGNLIIVAGGGYSSRNNRREGWNIAQCFNNLGYNCYVLQRRVAPYSGKDTYLDLSRGVRYIKNKIDELSLGGKDMITAVGFSGGSATILGAIAEFYGDCDYSQVDSTYTVDEIDSYTADFDVALCIYGPNYTSSPAGEFTGLITENENLPAFFLAAGIHDTAADDNVILADSIKDKTMVEIHTFANNGHGFGTGTEGTNSVYWIELADSYIDQCIALKTKEE